MIARILWHFKLFYGVAFLGALLLDLEGFLAVLDAEALGLTPDLTPLDPGVLSTGILPLALTITPLLAFVSLVFILFLF
jgi:hypothetical protein